MYNKLSEAGIAADANNKECFQKLAKSTYLLLLLVLLPGCTQSVRQQQKVSISGMSAHNESVQLPKTATAGGRLVMGKKVVDGISCIKLTNESPSGLPWWNLQLKEILRHSYRISPDRKSFAYKVPNGIVVLDLKSGTTSKHIAGSSYVIIGWRKDSKALFLGEYGNNNPMYDKVARSYICRLDQTHPKSIFLGNGILNDVRWSPDFRFLCWVETQPSLDTYEWKGQHYFLIPGVMGYKPGTQAKYRPIHFEAYYHLTDLNTGKDTTEAVELALVDKKRFCAGKCHGYCEFNSRSMYGRPAEIQKQRIDNPAIRGALDWPMEPGFEHDISDDSYCSIPPSYAGCGAGACGLEYTSLLNGAMSGTSALKMECRHQGKESRYINIELYDYGGVVWYPGTHTALLRVRNKDKTVFLRINDKGKRQEITLPDDDNGYVPAGIMKDGKTILVLKLDKDKKDTASLYTAYVKK